MTITICCLLCLLIGADDDTYFDLSPDHPANRLHRALFTRHQDGQVIGLDSLDPLIWPNSIHLLDDERLNRVLGALDAVSSTDLPISVRSRAILQNDLWAIFDGIAQGLGTGGPGQAERDEARETLMRRLVVTMRAIALDDHEIESLDSNLAAAIRSEAWPSRAIGRSGPFLPADLLEDGGRWRAVSQPGRMAAHIHNNSIGARSTFFVLLAVPEEQGGTAALIERLDARGLTAPSEKGHRLRTDLPGVPTGTQAALVRRLAVVNRNGERRTTRIVSSVQIREFVDESPQHQPPAARFDETQRLAEFRLSRARLLREETGGLAPLGPEDRRYTLIFHHGIDELGMQAPIELRTCRMCHAQEGVASLVSLIGLATGPGQIDQFEFSEPPLAPGLGTRNAELAKVDAVLRESRRWERLRELWDE
ncbi:MAG: hypothetical protein RL885_09435 [Planctomycetota bacterium]